MHFKFYTLFLTFFFFFPKRKQKPQWLMLYNLFALCCWGQTGFPFSGRIIEFPLCMTKTWFLDYFYIVVILINIVWLSGSTVDLKTLFFCLSFIKFSSIVRLLYLPSFWLSPLTFLINDNWISWIVFFFKLFPFKMLTSLFWENFLTLFCISLT